MLYSAFIGTIDNENIAHENTSNIDGEWLNWLRVSNGHSIMIQESNR